jgi:hypothetical protein
MSVELSEWQCPIDGFPDDIYFDHVITELERLGIGVYDSWRDEPWDAVIELDRAAYAGVIAAHDVVIGWRVSEESDPLHLEADEECHGFHRVGGLSPGWFWMRCKESGEGINPAELGHPDATGSPMDPLEDPAVVAAAVAKIVRPAEAQPPEPTP